MNVGNANRKTHAVIYTGQRRSENRAGENGPVWYESVRVLKGHGRVRQGSRFRDIPLDCWPLVILVVLYNLVARSGQ